MVHLRDICEISSGFSFRGGVRDEPGGAYRVVQLGDVDWGAEQVAWERLPRVSGIAPAQRHLLQAGDVLFAAKGRDNRAILVPEVDGVVAASTFFVLRPQPGCVLPDYVAWYVNTARAQVHVQAGSRGTNMRSVPKACIASLPVPLPPLDVQRRIAGAVGLAREERALMAMLMEKKSAFVESACLRLSGMA